LLIDGRRYAEDLKRTLREELAELPARAGIATILIGDDLAAQVYQRRIDRHAQELGIASRPVQLPGDATLGQVIGKLAELDVEPEITAILVLRPIPPHLQEARIFAALPPLKDVEAQHPENAGLLSLGTPRFVPSTPAAAFHMLDRHTADAGRDPRTAYDGVNLALVGRSNNVGKPAAILGLQRNATVISCHRHTFDAGRLREHTRAAEVLIVAVGVPGLVTRDHVRAGAIVIDVGINALERADGTVALVGDVDTADVEPVVEAVSPVPGGVGPITDIWVLRNAVTAAWLQAGAPRQHAAIPADARPGLGSMPA
jgi:methylenetetrahydrofolate dehydrogenase (NADP+) / methenyltetrahydrofolate cyclohydrolase